MTLFKLLDTLSPKIYILKFGKRKMAKIGHTEQEINRYIKAIRFKGKLKGREHKIELVGVFKTKKAESIEYYVKQILKAKYRPVNDGNMGRGYTEWFFCSDAQVFSAYLLACKYMKRKSKK